MLSDLEYCTFSLLRLYLFFQAESEVRKCQTKCGDVDVPYPFGIGPPHCYRPGFNLTCHYPSDKPPRLLLDSYGAFQVQHIFLQNTTVQVTSSVVVIEADSKKNFGFDFDDYFTSRMYSTRCPNRMSSSSQGATFRLHYLGAMHQSSAVALPFAPSKMSGPEGCRLRATRAGTASAAAKRAFPRPWREACLVY